LEVPVNRSFAAAAASFFVLASVAEAAPLATSRSAARAALHRIEAAVGRAPSVVWRKGAVPSVVTGRLTPPHTTGDAVQIARAFLRDHEGLLRARAAALTLRRTFVLPSGARVIRFVQEHAGLPVFGSAVAVTVDALGVVRTLSSRTHAVEDTNVAPRLAPLRALRIAQREGGFSRPTDNVRRATLGFLRMPGGMHLAWRVALPAVPALLSAPTLYVDADDGRVLRRESRIFFAKQGKVYRANPVSTPTVAQVEFPWLADNATRLESPRVKALNCVDNHTTTPVSFGGTSFNVHLCSEIHKAEANGSFDFLFDPVTASPGRDEDEFAEQMMFYHAHRIYDFFRGLGFDELTPSVGSNAQLQATANFRIPLDLANPPSDFLTILSVVSNPNGTLYPFDNAFFLAADGAQGFLDRSVDSLVFGQGTTADFAYDGDVIYHEFGHAVVRSTAELASTIIDEFGLDGAPGAMNEGYADYFSSALAGDAAVGEHVGQSLPAGMLAGAIRNLENTATCPTGLWGEVHNDSQPFTGALWAARTAVASGDRAKFDRAVFAGLLTLNTSSDFEDAASATLSAVRTELGASAETATRSTFEQRGLLGCNNRIIEYTAARRTTIVEGQGTLDVSPYVPGYTQLKIRSGSAPTRFTATWNEGRGITSVQGGLSSFFGGTSDVRVVVSEGSPIQFVYGSGNAIDNPGDFREIQPTARTTAGGKTFTAEWNGTAATDYYVMLVNRGQAQSVAQNLKIETAAVAPDGGATADAGTPATPDAGTTADGGTTSAGGKGGCSAAPGSSDTVPALVLLAWVFAFGAARRRTRRARSC
jgi:Zn-dependent metalloprotease